MAIGLYKYYDDANREYQVSLPDEFASALSYEPADAADPYLPRSISPRYCAYWNQSHNLYRAVVIPSKSSFVAPPQTVTADGLEWLLSGFYGEQFQQLPGGNMVVLSGVQGEKGDPGQLDDSAVVLFTDVQLTPINTGKELCRFDNLPLGDYLIFANVQFQTGAAAAEMSLVVGTTGASGMQLNGASIYGATASRFYPASLATRCTIINASNSIILYGQSTVASAFVRKFTDAGHIGTGLTIVKTS